MYRIALHEPLALLTLFCLVGALIALFVLAEVRLLGYAYARIGIRREHILSLLFLSLLGSYVNIPIARLPATQVVVHKTVLLYGMPYWIPVVVTHPGALLAVNLGGAVIPTVLSLYLTVKNRLYGRALIATAMVALVCHALAYPVPGQGIAEPTFVPPMATTLIALILSRRQAAALAYISGSLGTLIGADLWNLGVVRNLGAPVASIGGAGTFDGIFVTGILAVLLASLVKGGDPR
ncbi:MAG: DUF1614 domain-containing protein [Betaproteobacteria bacterium]|nr:DUF1614 domain-containing protein [Betaproteobacteria bacterium]